MSMYDTVQDLKMALLLENSLEMILFFDKTGKIFEANEVALRELGYDSLTEGIYINEVFSKAFRKMENGILFKRQGNKDVFETVAYRKNATCCPVDLKVNIHENQNEYIGLCVAVNAASKKLAIKEAQKAKEEIEESNQFRNEFVANVTHELRTPVNGVLGLTKNLMDTEVDKEQMQSLEIIEKCCQNMMKIINNLLDFSKLEAGKFTIEEREFSFRSFMDKTVATNLPAINEKGLHLKVNISQDIPDILIGDELRLTQILNNLLSNAIKFTEVGQISIEVVKTLQTDDEIEIFFVVIDSGIGIGEDEMDKLFKSFSQVDASITRRFGGTGLGLSIVKELVELMNGSIDVESEKGKGSTFSFTVRLKTHAQSKENIGEQSSVSTVAYHNLEKVGMGMKFPVNVEDDYDAERVKQFGTPENIKEIQNIMEKLIICIEMENWEKAEQFAGQVKNLIAEEETELRRAVFRLELIIRKEQAENAVRQYDAAKAALKEYFGENWIGGNN